MQNPLVTIICISFNHAKFIEDALKSVWDLDYPNIELIIADDASTDNSQPLIRKLITNKKVSLLMNSINIGHCKIFNKALKLAKGDFIIDFSADDLLLPNSVSLGIEKLNKNGKEYGVFYADAEIINQSNKIIKKHITISFFKNQVAPEGFIYEEIVKKYFINPVTMIFRTSMLLEIGGYDENLAYEDFDFWIKSSRNFKYCYEPIITVKKRLLKNSVSSKQYIKHSKMLVSTLFVCKKAFNLNKNKKEDFALLKRLAYEGKMSFFSKNYLLTFRFLFLFLKVFFKLR